MFDLKRIGLTAALLVGSVVAAQAAVISNGSFEFTGGGTSFGPVLVGNSSTITDWTVVGPAGASLDYVGSYWQAAEGTSSLDLNGGGAVGVSQNITGLTSGQAYRIAFDMAGNPDDAPIVKTMDVTVVGWGTQNYSFDTTGTDKTAMGWTTTYFDFVAGSSAQNLTFTSTTSASCWGPALDNVRISAVPLPAAGLLLLGAMGGLGFVSRKRKAA